jgi:hypothetical protein
MADFVVNTGAVAIHASILVVRYKQHHASSRCSVSLEYSLSLACNLSSILWASFGVRSELATHSIMP